MKIDMESIAKVIGQMARVAMIVHVLDNAVAIASQELASNEEANVILDIPSIVPKESVQEAIAVMNHIVDTKYAMMPPAEKLHSDAAINRANPSSHLRDAQPSPQQPQDYFLSETLTDLHGKYIKKVLLHKGTQGKASEVSGRHLMPPVTPLPNTSNRYPTTAAESFLKCMEDLGLGNIVRNQNNRSRETCILNKRPLEDLTTEARNKLRKISVTDKQYQQAMQ